jgi:hypothetical protein
METLERSLALAEVEEEEITPETAAVLDRSCASLARGESIPHDEILSHDMILRCGPDGR